MIDIFNDKLLQDISQNTEKRVEDLRKNIASLERYQDKIRIAQEHSNPIIRTAFLSPSFHDSQNLVSASIGGADYLFSPNCRQINSDERSRKGSSFKLYPKDKLVWSESETTYILDDSYRMRFNLHLDYSHSFSVFAYDEAGFDIMPRLDTISKREKVMLVSKLWIMMAQGEGYSPAISKCMGYYEANEMYYAD